MKNTITLLDYQISLDEFREWSDKNNIEFIGAGYRIQFVHQEDYILFHLTFTVSESYGYYHYLNRQYDL